MIDDRLIKCIGCGANVNVSVYTTPTQNKTQWGGWQRMPPTGWLQLFPTGGEWVCSESCADAFDGDHQKERAL